MKTAFGHLTYCSNIHPGESWKDHFSELKARFPSVKNAVSPDTPMGIGLRLSNTASLELLEGDNLAEFRGWLDSQGAYVFTMNGFPYGSFHHSTVKDQVHVPDWTTSDRVDYTIRLFRILSQLIPPGIEGGISTSPLSYKYWHKSEAAHQAARKQATKNVVLVLQELLLIREQTGQVLHLDIEPEPDGMLESGDEFIQWYVGELIPEAIERLGTRHSDAGSLIREHITLCYDICHFAIGFEEHKSVLQRLEGERIKVGKIQISAALKAVLPADNEPRTLISALFARFDEPTYLHQVVARTTGGSLLRYRDLPDALSEIYRPDVKEWRAHYHVPVFREDLGELQSTQSDIQELLKLHVSEPFSNHLEIETYTWDVLPEELKESIENSIIREIQWVKNELQ